MASFLNIAQRSNFFRNRNRLGVFRCRVSKISRPMPIPSNCFLLPTMINTEMASLTTRTIISSNNNDLSHRYFTQSPPKQQVRAFSSSFKNQTERRIQRNKEIRNLGKQQQWKEILDLYELEADEFSSANYAIALTQLKHTARVNKQDPALVRLIDDLATLIQERGLLWIDGRGLAMTAHALGKMKLKSQSAQKILDFIANDEKAVKSILSGRDTQAIASICWSMAKLGDAKNLEVFLSRIEADPAWFVKAANPQEVANTLWACGTLNVQAPNLCAAIDQDAARLVERGSSQEVANLAWACGKLQTRAPRLFAEIDGHTAVKKLVHERGKTQEVGNVAWACGRLGAPSPNLFAEIETHAKWFVTEGRPQHMSNVAWACARLKIPAPRLFAGIQSQAERLVEDDRSPQALANILWACGTLGQDAPQIFALMERRSKWLVDHGTTQAVANTAWACATVNSPSPRLFGEIAQHASRLVREGDTQNVANMAWAFAKLNVEDDDSSRFFSEIEMRSKWLVEQGSPQDISTTAWACATLHFYTPKLFSEIELRSAWLVEAGSTQTLVNTAWASATLGFQSRKFFRAISNNVDIIVKGGNQEQFAMLCFSLAILDLAKEYETEFCKLWAKALRFWNAERLGVEATTQLAQAHALATASGLELQEPPPCSFEVGVKLSRSHSEISALLHELGFSHELEVSPFKEGEEYMPKGLMAIDMACRKRMIAIDFDGPSHFLKDVGSGEVTSIEEGSRKAKRRFLERIGWEVATIRYVDWMEVNGKSNEEKKRHLQDILDVL
jgi:hypothetical protein